MSFIVSNSESNNISLGVTVVESFVNESQSSQLLLASNPNRKKAIIVNESKKSLFLRYVNPAILDLNIELDSGGIWIEDSYSGDIFGIWENKADNGARITEIS